MVVFYDLEDEKTLRSEQYLTQDSIIKAVRNLKISEGDHLNQKSVSNTDEKRENLNKEKAITKALGCYPVVREIAAHIDLNSLDALSSTCQQARVNLLQFHRQLINSTLRCENDVLRNGSGRAGYCSRTEKGEHNLSICPRDLVGSCRRCDRIVCRNCAIKPPSRHLLINRRRRLCQTCTRRELSSLIFPSTASSSIKSDPASVHSTLAQVSPDLIKLHLCNCSSDRLWLCRCCGGFILSADDEYRNIWKWRRRYLSSHGGIGIGIGEGDRGVPCGRGGECANAREVEQEIDCDAEDAREIDHHSKSGSPNRNLHSTNNSQMGPGYTRHEIEGIGGVMKKKLVKIVKVGACVPELKYEEDARSIIDWEQDKISRSWCAWCSRFIPGIDDVIIK